jgi:CRISP-associated protein Cas1
MAVPPDADAEEALMPISALQHYLFCPCQCALIHVERLWAEDGTTAEGHILHDRVDVGESEALTLAERRLTDAGRRALISPEVGLLRGIEGEAANAYFGVFSNLVRVADPAFTFTGRSRRPPLDRVNALLSFLYAMLGHDCRAACETHGLDPQVGFLRADRPGRAGLALDLMEELRPVLADRLALSLINRRQLTAHDFVLEEAGGVRLADATRKQVLVAWRERKREELRHPFLNEAMSLGLLASVQAQL